MLLVTVALVMPVVGVSPVMDRHARAVPSLLDATSHPVEVGRRPLGGGGGGVGGGVQGKADGGGTRWGDLGW